MTPLPLRRSLLLLAAAWAGVAAAGAQPPLRTAFLPFTLVDTSRPDPGEEPDPADIARLRRVEAEVAALLQKSGRYVAIGTSPIGRALAENDLYGCDGCAVQLARQLGAQAVVTGLVQKVSLLILDMSITIQAVASGRILAAGTVGLRGDNDRAWERAAAWLVVHRLLQ